MDKYIYNKKKRALVWAARGLLSALSETAGGTWGTHWYLGTTASPIPQRPSQSAVYLSAYQRQVEQLPCWHWPASRRNVLSAGKAAFRKGGRNGSNQSGKPNAVGTEDEQHPQCCYGSRIKRAYLSLTLHKKGRRQQTAAFLISGVIWNPHYTFCRRNPAVWYAVVDYFELIWYN